MRFSQKKTSLLWLSAWILFASSALQAETRWIGTWASAPVPVKNETALGSVPMTLRQTVHISQGGDTLRITLTNEFGTEPLTLSAASVAFFSAGDAIVDGTARPVTFSGSPSVTIAPGKFVTSDNIRLKLPIFSDLTVSLELPQQSIPTLTEHPLANQTNYLAQGNLAAAANLPDSRKEIHNWIFLKDLQVPSPGKRSGAIVTFGDSITDGARMSLNSNHRWPDFLAARLTTNKKTKNLGILNEGISGNRILHDIAGPRALDRFDRDVLAAPGVQYLVILEGINDIGRTYLPRPGAKPGEEAVTAQQIIDGLKTLVDRAHARQIKVIGATLTPFEGAPYFTGPEGENDRQAINTWIRTSGTFDGVIDFDKTVRDPAAPTKFLKKADSGDHLHPGDLGYQRMADGIDLKLFTK